MSKNLELRGVTLVARLGHIIGGRVGAKSLDEMDQPCSIGIAHVDVQPHFAFPYTTVTC